MEFKNEALTDFSNSFNREAMTQALDAVKGRLGRLYPAIIDGKRCKTKKTTRSINPSHSREVVGAVPDADLRLADRALASATQTFERWRRVPAEERAACLRRMSARLRERKMEFSAWLIYEVGKSWVEADADVAEAIDFLEYYAGLAVQPATTPARVSGERNEYRYLPIGPVVVLPPWNFPLAILVGMTSAALVTGNTVVLKPSSQSPVVGALFVDLAEAAGLPLGVLNFLPGSGGAIGDFLVRDVRTRMVAFTGSKEVGLRINALAAQFQKGQKWIKRVMAELGGKNAIIVDETADFENAVQGSFASAFAYQGQKCSACSRLFVHEKFYEAFTEAFVAKARAVRLGPAEVQDHFMGPVITAGAQARIQKAIALGARQGRLLSGGKRILEKEGFYLTPAVLANLPRSSALWQEEIFGPVVAIAPVRSLEEGLARANETAYGLTGAVYVRDEQRLQKAKDEFFCGNLYINRKSTGALVGGHPFGGFNLSGTDAKAGGPEYLLQFTQAQSISERLP
jgi:1-pyrroline-5-carboxylate dehydrogenase